MAEAEVRISADDSNDVTMSGGEPIEGDDNGAADAAGEDEDGDGEGGAGEAVEKATAVEDEKPIKTRISFAEYVHSTFSRIQIQLFEIITNLLLAIPATSNPPFAPSKSPPPLPPTPPQP